jgi:hypothetical protein
MGYHGDRMRVLCALAQTRGTGVSTRLTKLELAPAISGVPPRIEAVAAIAVAIHREFDQTPRVLDDALGASIADLAQIATDVAHAHSIKLLAPAVRAAGQLRQVLVVARAIEGGDQRAEALIALATHLPPDLAGVDLPSPDELLDEAQAAAVAW